MDGCVGGARDVFVGGGDADYYALGGGEIFHLVHSSRVLASVTLSEVRGRVR